MLIVIILLAAILGLTYGHYEEGFIFNKNICLFAGFTMVMPALFNFKVKEILHIYEYKNVILKNLFANYIIIPVIGIIIGLFTNNFGIAAGLFLLSIFGGGGMVMHWTKKSNADTSVGFILLFINLLLVSLGLVMLHFFGVYTSSYYGGAYTENRNISNYAEAVIYLLIIIPFITSRVLLFIKPLVKLIEKLRVYISQISIFIIIFYLFGLQNSQLLFELYDFEPELIPVSFIAVLVFYIAVFIVSKFLYDFNSAQDVAGFWQSITRYITLSLVISTFSISTFGVSVILPLMIAYVVQIPLAIIIDKWFISTIPSEQS